MCYLILDRDSKFAADFKKIIEDAGVIIALIGYQAPNMNAIAERWVLSVKSECLNRMIFFGEQSLRRALREYCTHYHQDRPHQGLGNAVILPAATTGSPTVAIVETERFGGLLRSYHRAA